MKVVLVEDSPLVRKHLLAALKEQHFLSVVGLAATEAEALCTVGLTRPHVVVLDLSLASGSGLEVLRKLRLAGFGGTILVLSNRDSEATARCACATARTPSTTRAASLKSSSAT